jgi:hypothetical protein
MVTISQQRRPIYHPKQRRRQTDPPETEKGGGRETEQI